jgi:chitin synthase
MWFFQGFCRQLKPKYCCLIDVGTVPHGNGIFEYFKAMEKDD